MIGMSQRAIPSVAPQKTAEKALSPESARRLEWEDLIARSGSLIKGVEAAKKYLERNCMTVEGEPYTTQSLSMTLLHLTQVRGMGRDAIDGMRAVAFILEEIEIAEEVRQRGEKVGGVLEEMEAKCVTMVDSVAMTMSQLLEEVENKMQNLTAGTPETVPPSQTTYASVVRTKEKGMPGVQVHPKPRSLQQAALLACEDAKVKQVLIEMVEGGGGLVEMSEKALVLKANLAVEATQTDNERRITVVGAKKLQNGGVILETKTKECAVALRKPSTREAFTKNFGADIWVKDRSHPIIVEHVSITFQPDISVELRKVEDASNLEDYSIISAKWIKPPHWQSPGQQVAHLIVNIASAEKANTIIRAGMIIAGKQVFGRKLMQEPRRCYKCQGIGVAHVASTCPQVNDTCGRCAGKHKTIECMVVDPARFKCANCGVEGHAAGGRECPKFEEQRIKFITNNKANKYRFFLVGEDPSTWEMMEQELVENSQWQEKKLPVDVGDGRNTSGTGHETEGGGEAPRATSRSWYEEVEQERRGEGEISGTQQRGLQGTQTSLLGWATTTQVKMIDQSSTHISQNE